MIYPASAITCRSFSVLIGSSDNMTVSLFFRELVTFLTGNAARTASLMCASHMPQIIPEICTVVLITVFSPLVKYRRRGSSSAPPCGSGWFMAGTGHGTMAAVSAAGGSPLLFVFPQPDNDSRHQSDQYKTDDNGSRVVSDSLDHFLTPFVSAGSLHGIS